MSGNTVADHDALLSTIGLHVRTSRRWWNSTIDFEWLRDYHVAHPLLRYAPYAMSSYCALIAAIAGAFLVATPNSGVTRIVLVAAITGSLVLAALWGRGQFPTRSQSRVFVVVSDVIIAAYLLVLPTSLVTLLSSTILVASAHYINVYHSPRAVILHGLLSLAVAAILVVRVLAQGTVPIAETVAVFLTVLVVILGSTVLTHILFTAIRNDAARAVFDQLTGLLNRRGLEVAMDRLLTEARESAGPSVTVLTAICIDLDAFKTVNDRFGHSTGDDVLSHTARRIESESTDRRVAARVGGEEFVMIIVENDESGPTVAEQLRRSIYRPDDLAPVSASIGVASQRLFSVHYDTEIVLDHLMNQADMAMYTAKRRGGNRVVTYTDAMQDGVSGH